MTRSPRRSAVIVITCAAAAYSTQVTAQRAGDDPGPGSDRAGGRTPSPPPGSANDGSAHRGSGENGSAEEFAPLVAGTSVVVKQTLTMATETLTRVGQKTMSSTPIRSETSTKMSQTLEIVKVDKDGLALRTLGPLVEGEPAPSASAARTLSLNLDGTVREATGLDDDTRGILEETSDLVVRMFGSSEVAHTTGNSFSVSAKRALLLLAPGIDQPDGTWTFKRRPQQPDAGVAFDITVSNGSGAFTNWAGSATIIAPDGAVTIELHATATQPIVPDKEAAQEIKETLAGLSKVHAQAEIQQTVKYERRVERVSSSKGRSQGRK